MDGRREALIVATGHLQATPGFRRPAGPRPRTPGPPPPGCWRTPPIGGLRRPAGCSTSPRTCSPRVLGGTVSSPTPRAFADRLLVYISLPTAFQGTTTAGCNFRRLGQPKGTCFASTALLGPAAERPDRAAAGPERSSCSSTLLLTAVRSCREAKGGPGGPPLRGTSSPVRGPGDPDGPPARSSMPGRAITCWGRAGHRCFNGRDPSRAWRRGRPTIEHGRSWSSVDDPVQSTRYQRRPGRPMPGHTPAGLSACGPSSPDLYIRGRQPAPRRAFGLTRAAGGGGALAVERVLGEAGRRRPSLRRRRSSHPPLPAGAAARAAGSAPPAGLGPSPRRSRGGRIDGCVRCLARRAPAVRRSGGRRPCQSARIGVGAARRYCTGWRSHWSQPRLPERPRGLLPGPSPGVARRHPRPPGAGRPAEAGREAALGPARGPDW